MWIALLSAGLAATAAPNESAVERYHRKGVHCMDVIERSKCAIEQFELVLDEDTRDRELVTDSMLRLIRLYRKTGDADGLASVLRRYWDVGTDRQSKGHLPYGMRFVSAEFDVMFLADIDAMRDAQVLREAGPDTAEFILTCNEQRREDILMTERWSRAQAEAARRGLPTHQVFYEAMDERRARRTRARSEARSRPDADEETVAPIFSEIPCELAKRLGYDSLRSWKRMAGVASHQNYQRSMMIAEIPDLLPRAARAVEDGGLERVGDDHWSLAGVEFAGQTVHMVRVDLDQVIVGRDDMIEGVLNAKSKRRHRMNRELERLAQHIPRDSGFMFAMTQAAVIGSGFGNMRQGASTVLQALLPKPKGLQVSVSTRDVAGVFTRVPTNTPLKARMLVGLARSVIEGQARDDPEASKWLENLDIAEAGDRRALLAAYLMEAARLGDLLYQ